MHQETAAILERCVAQIREIQQQARRSGIARRPRWPMIILRTPKGWTCPKELDGHRLEGFWRAHQLSVTDVISNSARKPLRMPEFRSNSRARLCEKLEWSKLVSSISMSGNQRNKSL